MIQPFSSLASLSTPHHILGVAENKKRKEKKSCTNQSSFKTPSMMVVVMVMMMVVGVFLVDDALDGAELLHVAGDGDGAFLIKAILVFSLLEKLHEERVVDVYHRDHKPLLLLSLTHQYCKTAFWDVLQILLLLKMDVRKMNVEINQMVLLMMMMIADIIITIIMNVSTSNPHVEENIKLIKNPRFNI